MTPYVKTRCASHSRARKGRAGEAVPAYGKTAPYPARRAPCGSSRSRLLSMFALWVGGRHTPVGRNQTAWGIQTP